MPAYLSPVGNEQQSDANGAPVSGALIATYLAGTTTPVVTYSDAAGTVPQSNPVVCNSAGYPTSPIYLPAGQAVKMVFTTSVASGSVAYRPTVDNIEGVNDPSFSATVSEWQPFSGTPTYINATSFSVAGDQTNVLPIGRQLKTTNTGGTAYSTIANAVFAAGATTITVANVSGALDSGLSVVSYGLLDPANPSLPKSAAVRAALGVPTQATRADVASAATLDLSANAPITDDINVTGTTTITAVTVAVGRVVRVRFAASLTLTNGAGLVTNTGADIKTQAGDSCILRATAANTVEIVGYSRAFETATTGSTGKSCIRLNTLAGYGSTNTMIMRFTNVVLNQGSDITRATSAADGDSFTINTAGDYAISVAASFTGGADFGVTLNSAQLTTAFNATTVADRLCGVTSGGANLLATASNGGVYLPAGSILRVHGDGTAGGGRAALLTITRVA